MNRANSLLARGAHAIIIAFIFFSGVNLLFPGVTQLVQTQLLTFLSSNRNTQAGQEQPQDGVQKGLYKNEAVR